MLLTFLPSFFHFKLQYGSLGPPPPSGGLLANSSPGAVGSGTTAVSVNVAAAGAAVVSATGPVPPGDQQQPVFGHQLLLQPPQFCK